MFYVQPQNVILTPKVGSNSHMFGMRGSPERIGQMDSKSHDPRIASSLHGAGSRECDQHWRPAQCDLLWKFVDDAVVVGP